MCLAGSSRGGERVRVLYCLGGGGGWRSFSSLGGGGGGREAGLGGKSLFFLRWGLKEEFASRKNGRGGEFFSSFSWRGGEEEGGRLRGGERGGKKTRFSLRPGKEGKVGGGLSFRGGMTAARAAPDASGGRRGKTEGKEGAGMVRRRTGDKLFLFRIDTKDGRGGGERFVFV